MEKKIPLEELIRIAKENHHTYVEEAEYEDLNDAQKFVIKFKLKEGKNKILSPLIYEAYCNWQDRPLSKVKFTEQFSKIFHECNSSNRRYYRLNLKPMQLINDSIKKTKGKSSE